MLLSVLRILFICLLGPVALVLADEKPAAPAPPPAQKSLGAHHQFTYGMVQKILVRSAETMPEENYGFKPTEAVRSFGQMVGHVADSQYYFCSVALGEKNPAPNVEKTKTSKADLIAALKEAFAYCDKAYGGITDETAKEIVKFMGGTPRLGVLAINEMHSMEHYGNLVTYMRLKNLVPPTSDQAFMKQASGR